MIDELRKLYERATQGDWLLGYDRLNQPVVKDSNGRVIVEADTYAADVELIVAMHRAIPKLLAELEDAKRDAMVARIAYERSMNEHLASMQSTLEHGREQSAAIDKAQADLVKLGDMIDHLVAERDRLKREYERMSPLVSAVEKWAMHRHAPSLVAAWDRYRAACEKH